MKIKISGFNQNYYFSLFDDDNNLIDSKKIEISGDVIKLFENYEYYFDNWNIYQLVDDKKLSVILEYDKFFINSFVNDDTRGSFNINFITLSKNYDLSTYIDVNNLKVVIFQDIFVQDDNEYHLDIKLDFENHLIINNSYIKSGDDNLSFVSFFNIDFNYIFNQLFPNDIVFSISEQLSSQMDGVHQHLSGISDSFSSLINPIKNQLDSVDNKVGLLSPLINEIGNSIFNKVDNIDFTSLMNKIDASVNELNTNLSNIHFDFDEEHFLNSLKSFFTLHLLDLSLNGANGAKFSDGENVVIDGYSGIWEVEASMQALVDDNNLTILYKVKKDNKSMIVPSAFVNNQGA